MIDAGFLEVLVIGAQANPYAARIVSVLAAASATWVLNRRYTFGSRHSPTHTEWLRYVAFMAIGGCVNYGAFALCIAFWPLSRAYLWIGVAVGAIAGLGVNFSTSRFLYRQPILRSCNHEVLHGE